MSVTLSSCGSTQAQAPVAYIGRNLAITLPSPRDFGHTIRVLQLVTARHQNEDYVFEATVSITPERLNLIGIDMLGRRALSLSLTDAGIAAARAPWLPDFIRPENIVADIAVIYWPENILRRHLQSGFATLDVEEKRRTISVDGRDVIRVEYSSGQDGAFAGSVHYRNFDLGYELHLRSAAVAQ